MSTDPPTKLTTTQLIEACAHEEVTVSPVQLARWVRAGLIPETLRARHGRGRGQGMSEWLWDAECLPRAIIIKSTLAQGNPSFQRAAMALAAAGYAPGAEYLRAGLLDVLNVLERHFTHRQAYLKDDTQPISEKRARLAHNIRRKGATLPDRLTQSLTLIGTAVHGLADKKPGENDLVGGLQPYLSIAAMRERLIQLDAHTIVERFEAAGHMLPQVLSPLLMITNLLILPFLRQRIQEAGNSASSLPMDLDAATIMAGMRQEEGENGRILVPPGNLAGAVRMLLALLLAGMPTDVLSQEALIAEQGAAFGGEVLGLIGAYIGVPWPHEVLESPETSDTPAEVN